VNIFTQVGTDTDWKYISCGWQHTMAIKNDGTLWGTGRNEYGQLSLGDVNLRNIFTQENTNDTNWKIVSGGWQHTMAIKNDGTLWGTGKNDKGQISIENIGTTFTAWLVSSMSVFKITSYALPCVGVGFAIMSFAKTKKRRSIGDVILGFGLLFIGLHYLKIHPDSQPNIYLRIFQPH